jgi:hypothetical protein
VQKREAGGAAELGALDAELREARAHLDRYFRAFEAETLSVEA